MATFGAFLDTLPDPNTPIGDAGQALAVGSGGVAGPGFSSIRVSSNRKTMVDKTNSGRAVSRAIAGHTWNIEINYNPLTRDQFEPVYNFLLTRLGRLKPFYVILPNQASTRNASVPALKVQVHANHTPAAAGQNYMMVDSTADISSSNYLRPGDMFNINDSINDNHVKTYRVTRVENEDDHDTQLPDGSTDFPANAKELRIHFTPPLSYPIPDTTPLVFTNPKIRVRLIDDVQEYELGTNNLYEFSLKLEEALP